MAPSAAAAANASSAHVDKVQALAESLADDYSGVSVEEIEDEAIAQCMDMDANDDDDSAEPPVQTDAGCLPRWCAAANRGIALLSAQEAALTNTAIGF